MTHTGKHSTLRSHQQFIARIGMTLVMCLAGSQSLFGKDCFKPAPCLLIAGPDCISAATSLPAIDVSTPVQEGGWKSGGGNGCGINRPIWFLPFIWWRCGPPVALPCDMHPIIPGAIDGPTDHHKHL